MAVFWLTFRIEHNATYGQRYETLLETIQMNSSSVWDESTSFYVFDANATIDGMASSIKASIDPKTDMALLGMPYFKDARLIGDSVDKKIYGLMDFLKYL